MVKGEGRHPLPNLMTLIYDDHYHFIRSVMSLANVYVHFMARGLPKTDYFWVFEKEKYLIDLNVLKFVLYYSQLPVTREKWWY